MDFKVYNLNCFMELLWMFVGSKFYRLIVSFPEFIPFQSQKIILSRIHLFWLLVTCLLENGLTCWNVHHRLDLICSGTHNPCVLKICHRTFFWFVLCIQSFCIEVSYNYFCRKHFNSHRWHLNLFDMFPWFSYTFS